MFAAMMRLDFIGAFGANPAVLLLSPFLLAIFLKYVADYIKTGRFAMGFVQNVILWFCIVLLVLFGIARNIFPGT